VFEKEIIAAGIRPALRRPGARGCQHGDEFSKGGRE
jgi:hypothetical protein